MTDKELIQLYKMCNELETCEGCPERSDFGLCPLDRYCNLDELIPRLEALLAENAEMDIQIQKEICKRVEVEAENERLREVTKMMPRWVSVSERLPESEGQVLVTFTGKIQNKEYIGGYLLAEYVPGDGWILEEYPQLENPNVTYWCELPRTAQHRGGGVNEQMRNL